MTILNQIWEGWKNIFNKVINLSFVNFADLAWIIPLTLSLILVLLLSYRILQAKIKRRRYLINKNHVSVKKKLTNWMLKYELIKALLNKIALKICVFNERSIEKNLEYSSVLLVFTLFFILANFIFLIPSSIILWYYVVFFIIFIIIFIALVFYIINIVIRYSFTKQLPRTFKLLNSRFSKKGDILQAIDISLEDFDKAIARELTRVSEILVKNDEDRINKEFEMIDRIYNDEYFTILLNLIKHAYYKPGNDAVKKVFSHTTSSILLELQVQKKLSLANIWYIVMSFLVPYGVVKVKEFNLHTLGEDVHKFYSSPLGIGFEVLIYLSMFTYILGLLLLRRTA